MYEEEKNLSVYAQPSSGRVLIIVCDDRSELFRIINP